MPKDDAAKKIHSHVFNDNLKADNCLIDSINNGLEGYLKREQRYSSKDENLRSTWQIFSRLRRTSKVARTFNGRPSCNGTILLEGPQDKKLVLKFLKGKKDVKEALEGFGIKDILKEEG
jgi:hypothetical protein